MKKTILCLIGVATLFLTNGCVVRTHERGGYYGRTEFESGVVVRTYPERRYDRHGYWEGGYYHRQPYRTYDGSRGYYYRRY
jgi:hypothetical protein